MLSFSRIYCYVYATFHSIFNAIIQINFSRKYSLIRLVAVHYFPVNTHAQTSAHIDTLFSSPFLHILNTNLAFSLSIIADQHLTVHFRHNGQSSLFLNFLKFRYASHISIKMRVEFQLSFELGLIVQMEWLRYF